MYCFSGIGQDVLKYLNSRTGEVNESPVGTCMNKGNRGKPGQEIYLRFDALIGRQDCSWEGAGTCCSEEFLCSDACVLSVTAEPVWEERSLANAVSALQMTRGSTNVIPYLSIFAGPGRQTAPCRSSGTC